MISNFIGGALKWAAMDEPKLLVQGGGHQTVQRLRYVGTLLATQR